MSSYQILEYVWLDKDLNLRSKTRTIGNRYLLDYELELFKDPKKFQSTSIRPFYLKTENKLSIKFNNEVYFNNNASNQENMDLRYIGKGIGHYKSLSISAYSKYLAFNFEPFSLIHNYKDAKEYYRPNPYKRLNDAKTKENA